jgi:hypothetical protein
MGIIYASVFYMGEQLHPHENRNGATFCLASGFTENLCFWTGAVADNRKKFQKNPIV